MNPNRGALPAHPVPARRCPRVLRHPVAPLSFAFFIGWLALAGICSAIEAQPAPSENPAATREAEPSKGAQPAGPPAAVEGFRDAHFGMNEEEVRRALHKDFPGPAGKLKVSVHPSEKTTVLALRVPDLLPNTGTAEVSYILGYRSKTLIQINILWRSNGSEAGDQTVVGTANALRDYFAAQRYKPGSEIANRQLDEHSILVFRGADAQGRMVTAVLSGAAAAARNAAKPPAPPPLILELSYIRDPAHPDVFHIAKGQF